MIEEFEYEGIWWLPDKPEEQISGTLRFTPEEGAILDLIGSFRDIKDIDKKLKPEIILGISSNGKNITLYKCFETKSTLSNRGFLTSSFYANLVFVGAHFERKEDIKFKKLSIHYSYLNEWVNVSGFDIPEFNHNKEVVIKFKPPEPIQASISKDYKILINFRYTFSPSMEMVAIKQKTFLTIEPLEEKSFDEYRSIMYHLQNFLSLGIMKAVYPLTIEGTTEVNKQMIKGKPCYPPIKIFYKLPEIPKATKTILPYMLFTFRDISDRFESILKNWFEKADLLKPVYDLYFGTLYNPRMYLEHRFLSLIKAIESFHRIIHGGEYLSAEDYKPVYDSLIKAIPDCVRNDLKERLKEYLKYGREFSLRKRLKEMLDKYQEILYKFIRNTNTFIEKVVNTRNYYTHHDKDLKEHSASGEELYHLTQKLKMLVEVCLLSELGFSSEEIKSLFLRRYQDNSFQ